MFTHVIYIDDLAKFIPLQVKAFRELCFRYGLTIDEAVHSLAENEMGFLVEGDHDEEVVLAQLRAAFNAMSDAVGEYTKVEGMPPLALEAHYNDSEMEGFGPYIRVARSVMLNPAMKNITDFVCKRELSVIKSNDAWKEESSHTGL